MLNRWEADGAAFEVGVPGARVTVRNHSNSEPYEARAITITTIIIIIIVLLLCYDIVNIITIIIIID